MTGHRPHPHAVPRGVAVLLAVAAVVLAGCGVRPTGVIGAGAAPTATATSLPRVTVYFLRHGHLSPVVRTVPPWNVEAVFDALLAGPTAGERARGLRTALDGTDITLRDLGKGGLYVVSANGRPVPLLAYAQVMCTVARLPGRSGTPILGPPAVVKMVAAECPERRGLPWIAPYGATPDGTGTQPSPEPSAAPLTGPAADHRAFPRTPRYPATPVS